MAAVRARWPVRCRRGASALVARSTNGTKGGFELRREPPSAVAPLADLPELTARKAVQYRPRLMSAIVVVTTVGTEDQANVVARELVARRQAACVNIIPGARSVYRWKGKISTDGEWMLVIKTLAEEFDGVAATIHELHDYELQLRHEGESRRVYTGRRPEAHVSGLPDGRYELGLPDDEALWQDVRVYSLRRLPGDDASCLSLATPGPPRLLGVDPAAFSARGASCPERPR